MTREQQLEEDLSMARRAILELVPEIYAEILSAYPDESVKHAYDWLREVVEAILDRIEETLDPHEKIVLVQAPYDPDLLLRPFRPSRLPCPLCRRKPQTVGAIGFAFPDGLRRHLLGDYNATMCPVTNAAKELCNERLHSEFRFIGRRRD